MKEGGEYKWVKWVSVAIKVEKSKSWHDTKS